MINATVNALEKVEQDVRTIYERVRLAERGMDLVISSCKRLVVDIGITLGELRNVKDDVRLVKETGKVIEDLFLIRCNLEHKAEFYAEVISNVEKAIDDVLSRLSKLVEERSPANK